MRFLLLSLVFVLSSCLDWSSTQSFHTTKGQQSNNAEWSQRQADSFHSSSLTVQGPPPSVQMIKIPYSGGVRDASLYIQNLVLHSSGRIIFTSGTAHSPQSEDEYIYCRNFQSDADSWVQNITTNSGLLSGLVISSDGSTGAIQASMYYVSNQRVFSFNIENGKLMGFGNTGTTSQRMLACPNTNSTFLVQDDKGYDWIDPNLKPFSLNWILETHNSSHYYWSTHRLVTDPTFPRVAHLDISWERYPAPRVLYIGLTVSNVKSDEINGVQFSHSWSFPFPTYSAVNVVDQYSTPAFTCDGNLFFAHKLAQTGAVTLYCFDGRTGTQQISPIIISDAQINFRWKMDTMAITSDGSYVILKGGRNDNSSKDTTDLLVVSMKDRSYTKLTNLVDPSWPKEYMPTDFLLTAIDEENSIVYVANYCTLTAFCLQNPKATHWNVTICDKAPDSGYASTLALGKYSGGQRRLFIGLSGTRGVTQIEVIEPPVHQC